MPEDIKLDDILPKVKMQQKQNDAGFETKKNREALLYTAIIAGTLLLISILYSFKSPLPDPPPPPPKEDLVEVELDEINFGNDANGGLNDLQPLRKFDPAPAEEEPEPQTNQKVADPTPPTNPVTDDNQDDAPHVAKPDQRMPTATKPRAAASNNTRPNTSSQQQTTTPTRKNPSALFRKPGATGPGGNNASNNNGVSQMGNSRGTGVQGNENGVPGGRGTIVLKNADLNNRSSIANMLSNSGTNYNGTVHLEINVDANGNYAGIRNITASPSNAAGKAAISYVKSNILSQLRFDAGASNRKAIIDLVFRHND